MAKKKKSSASQQRPSGTQSAQRTETPAAAALRKSTSQYEPESDDIELADLFKHPLLILAWASLIVTAFAVWAAFHYRHDLSMGELSEPTHIVVWSAVSFTLFASYWRKMRRDKKSDS